LQIKYGKYIINMSDNTAINDQFREFLTLNNELVDLRKMVNDKKKLVDKLEKTIKSYMTANNMDSIAMNEGEIVLYSRKVNQSFKKEALIETLHEQLNDQNKAEELTQSIMQNKKFVMEEKLKAVMKKKK
jgi:hypothetical protein